MYLFALLEQLIPDVARAICAKRMWQPHNYNDLVVILLHTEALFSDVPLGLRPGHNYDGALRHVEAAPMNILHICRMHATPRVPYANRFIITHSSRVSSCVSVCVSRLRVFVFCYWCSLASGDPKRQTRRSLFIITGSRTGHKRRMRFAHDATSTTRVRLSSAAAAG